MRIISYNILDGGEGRADPLAEVIEAQRPDVVAIVEAEDLSVLERIAKRLHMDYVQAVGKHGKASALLSRHPILHTTNHGAFDNALTKSCLEATVRTPDLGDLPIAVLHLAAGAYDADEQSRERELATLLKIFAPHRAASRPHLLAGDFNANSPLQQIDPARCKEKTQKAWKANGQQLPRRVIQSLLDHGYIDTLPSPTLTTFSTKSPGQRVDYILTHSLPPTRIKSAWIETDRLATYASDHYPTCAEII